MTLEESIKEEEEERDAKGGFSTEVRNQDYLGELIVFGYDSDEDGEALTDNDKDTTLKEKEHISSEAEKPQENNGVTDRALAINKDTLIHIKEKILE